MLGFHPQHPMLKQRCDMAKNKGDNGKLDTKTDDSQTPPEETIPSETKNFHIIGIGASAGGLEALEQFVSNMPSDNGIAFVIVQHLDPTAHSSMPETLSRFTKMPAKVASNGLKGEPNSVYLVPPGKSMSIQTCMLYLQELMQPPTLKLPMISSFVPYPRKRAFARGNTKILTIGGQHV